MSAYKKLDFAQNLIYLQCVKLYFFKNNIKKYIKWGKKSL